MTFEHSACETLCTDRSRQSRRIHQYHWNQFIVVFLRKPDCLYSVLWLDTYPLMDQQNQARRLCSLPSASPSDDVRILMSSTVTHHLTWWTVRLRICGLDSVWAATSGLARKVAYHTDWIPTSRLVVRSKPRLGIFFVWVWLNPLPNQRKTCICWKTGSTVQSRAIHFTCRSNYRPVQQTYASWYRRTGKLEYGREEMPSRTRFASPYYSFTSILKLCYQAPKKHFSPTAFLRVRLNTRICCKSSGVVRT